ncbi:hypothetical protein [Acinetobacter indicus]|uniref:hypothetical protein n=1 Tax=Acinetobacter indicus TaxID=756892 RepID=UPI0014440A98|nr:hypothetical protein [Acinetobacter indicus]
MSIHRQNGSTLIVVMFILIIITIIGALAAKSGMLGLKMATNSQAVHILNQNTDAAFIPIEDSNKISSYLIGTGIFGFPKMEANRNRELVFCYKGSEANFYSLRRASLIYIDEVGNLKKDSLGVDGYCKAESGFFSSGRSATLTQISVRVGTPTNTPVVPFSGVAEGTDTEGGKVDEAAYMVVAVTSVMPVLSDADRDEITDCMQNLSYVSPGSSQITISECLEGLGVPYKTQISEYNLNQIVKKSTTTSDDASASI